MIIDTIPHCCPVTCENKVSQSGMSDAARMPKCPELTAAALSQGIQMNMRGHFSGGERGGRELRLWLLTMDSRIICIYQGARLRSHTEANAEVWGSTSLETRRATFDCNSLIMVYPQLKATEYGSTQNRVWPRQSYALGLSPY